MLSNSFRNPIQTLYGIQSLQEISNSELTDREAFILRDTLENSTSAVKHLCFALEVNEVGLERIVYRLNNKIIEGLAVVLTGKSYCLSSSTGGLSLHKVEEKPHEKNVGKTHTARLFSNT